MNIVIVGAGEVGYHLADILSREEHRVSIVDPDPTKSRRMTEALDVMVLVGDGARADVLNNAGASKAELVIAVTDDDHTNMLACTMASHLGAERCILRLKDTRPLDEYRYFYKQTLGFDVVLSTDELAAEEIVNTVREQHALEVESFAGGRVQLRRFRIPSGSALAQGKIAELTLPGRVLIVAVSRGDRFFVPTGEDQLNAEDQIYIIGSRGDLDGFEQFAGAPALRRRSVVLLGAGGVGRGIAHKLRDFDGVSIRIIERDPVRARAVASDHSTQVMVIEGDATDLDLL
ncbi:MAG: NAD-binding protein, partial [Planctomycetota bacterium]